MTQLVLVANPGSASRKYALYDDTLTERARLHVENGNGSIICTLFIGGESRVIEPLFTDLRDTARHVIQLFTDAGAVGQEDTVSAIGLRIVAPGEFFLQDHIVTDDVITKLEQVYHLVPLHIAASLHELQLLKESYPDVSIVGVSDSAFHTTKPNYTWNYGINIHDADRFGIKRYGYHGLSVSASVDALWNSGKLPPKVVVCHLGSGSSVSAVFHGRSIDTTMGYTPLEGVIMASRSGTIDFGAVRALKTNLSMSDDQVEEYLNTQGGLLGLSGSDDIRVLLDREASGDHAAHLALATLIHSYHKAIGGMIVALNGCDLLVFTGTVGERSAILRKRIVAHLECLDFILDGEANEACTGPSKMTFISQKAASRPIVVIPADEAKRIALHTLTAISQSHA
ncbi:hypothetical protein EOL96_02385 [Candidatus Saccharibacteria bacterium]|nr:hypothetical protein [Candidatus Saccharibacteria bacterium]